MTIPVPGWFRHIRRLGKARDDIADEIDFHLAMEVERLEADGVSRFDAERIALDTFGDVAAIEKECRQIRGSAAEDIACEVRSACLSLATERRYTLPAFIGLALAMTLMAVAFSMFDSIMLKLAPYNSRDRVMRIWSLVPGVGPDARWGVAKGQFQFIERESRSFSALGLYRFETVTARPDDTAKPSRLIAMTTSAGTLDVLGIRPLLGRGITRSDNLADRPEVALVSYDTWEKGYNRDPRVLDRMIDVDGNMIRIIGVLPPEATFPEEMEEANFSHPGVLLPLRLNPADPAENHHVFRAVGLLARGVRAADAELELQRLVARFSGELPAAYPAAFMEKTGFAMQLVPISREVGGDSTIPLLVMLGAAALLMSLACVTAWSVPVRDPASRLSPFASEMVLLVAPAAATALVLAAAVLRVLPPLDEHPRYAGVELTARATAFTLLLGAVAATMLAGIRSTSLRKSFTSRNVPVLGQITIAVTLLILAGTTNRRISELKSTSPGFDATNAITISVSLPARDYDSHEAVSLFHRELARKLESIDGVDAAGMTTSLPLTGFDGCSAVRSDADLESRCVPVYFVTPGYLSALGVSMHGREVQSTDEPAAVVSASFASRTWPGMNPAGRTLRLGPSTQSYRVVGVAGDVKSRGLDEAPRDDVYVPITPLSGWNGWPPVTDMTLVIRSSRVDPRLIAEYAQAAIRSIDEGVETGSVKSLTDIVAVTISRHVFPGWFISATAAIAVLLSLFSLSTRLRVPAVVTPLRISAARHPFIHSFNDH